MSRHTFSNFPWGKYRCIQDPLYESYIDCDIFYETYYDTLRLLDGSDCASYMEEFFEVSVVNNCMKSASYGGHVEITELLKSKLDQ